MILQELKFEIRAFSGKKFLLAPDCLRIRTWSAGAWGREGQGCFCPGCGEFLACLFLFMFLHDSSCLLCALRDLSGSGLSGLGRLQRLILLNTTRREFSIIKRWKAFVRQARASALSTRFPSVGESYRHPGEACPGSIKSGGRGPEILTSLDGLCARRAGS